MTLDSYRDHVKPIIDPVVSACIRLKITPDCCTAISLVAAAVAGGGFYLSEIGIGTLCILLNAIFDALDGSIARAMNIQSMSPTRPVRPRRTRRSMQSGEGLEGAMGACPP